MSTISEILEKENIKLENVVNVSSGQLNGVIAEIKTADIDEQAKTVIELKRMKLLLDGFRKQLNNIISSSEETLCRTITYESEEIPYHCGDATITPTARGFYTLKDIPDFIEWMKKRDESISYGEIVQIVHDVAKSKTACNKFFDDILKGGEALPKCVGKYIVPKVTIRNLNSSLGIEDI